MASLVECVEALTVVLAVGAVRGWRCALIGVAAALGTLLALIAVFGRSIEAIPLRWVQVIIGTLVLMFGLRWLRKAILRSAAVIALHDEAAVYARQSMLLQRDAGLRDNGRLDNDQSHNGMGLRRASTVRGAWDQVAFATAFNIVMLEGIEVVFIVIALAANGRAFWPAASGAGLALGLVIALGALLHRPLQRIPENLLKFIVGILLSALGTLWVGESFGLHWPGGNGAGALLAAAYLLCALALTAACRGRVSRPTIARATVPVRRGALGRAVQELVALFVDDGVLATGILVWVAIATLLLPLSSMPGSSQCAVFWVGLAATLSYSVSLRTSPRL